MFFKISLYFLKLYSKRHLLSSFLVILCFAKPIGDFILKNIALKILALAFLIVIGITIFMEGLGKEVEKSMIYVPMGFAMLIELLQMRHSHNLKQIKNSD